MYYILFQFKGYYAAHLPYFPSHNDPKPCDISDSGSALMRSSYRFHVSDISKFMI